MFALQREPRTGGLAHVADGLVGLHAARHSGPYVAAWARVGASADADHLLTPARGGLCFLRCMRGTIHAAAAPTAAVLAAATRQQRVRAAHAAAARAGHGPAELRRARASLLEQLESTDADGCLEETLVDGPSSAAVLRLLWHEGAVTARDLSGTPETKRRGFVLTSRLREWVEPDEGQARVELLRRYLAAYGPAETADIAWWTGWGTRGTQHAIDALAGDLITVQVIGSRQPMLALAADEPILREIPAVTPAEVRLLAYEDPTIKAYYRTRWRYLGEIDAARLFWHSGEALASVTVGGIVAATWRWQTSSRRVRWDPVRQLRDEESAAVRHVVQHVGSWLRGWSNQSRGLIPSRR